MPQVLAAAAAFIISAGQAIAASTVLSTLVQVGASMPLSRCSEPEPGEGQEWREASQ
jgi:hypothetical protein